jgi:hypothetical protein
MLAREENRGGITIEKETLHHTVDAIQRHSPKTTWAKSYSDSPRTRDRAVEASCQTSLSSNHPQRSHRAVRLIKIPQRQTDYVQTYKLPKRVQDEAAIAVVMLWMQRMPRT